MITKKKLFNPGNNLSSKKEPSRKEEKLNNCKKFKENLFHLKFYWPNLYRIKRRE